eukprot:scaffold48631_cov57-Attheya_sp.AAC.3
MEFLKKNQIYRLRVDNYNNSPVLIPGFLIELHLSLIHIDNLKEEELYDLIKDLPINNNSKTFQDWTVANKRRESFSFKVLLSGCTDFIEEKTLLQHMREEIGNDRRIKITIDRTPKCHPEVAGEGIEYSWAMSKFYIRSVPINKRRTLSQFHEHVKFVLLRTEGAKMTKEKIRKFSVRARDFIAAYHVLHADGGGKAHPNPNGKKHTQN